MSAMATKPDLHEATKRSYDEAVKEAAVPIEAKLLSLPAEGGTFDARRYLGGELLAYMDAKPTAMLKSTRWVNRSQARPLISECIRD